jgi:antimicrobial peptide system SdpB family protein
MKDKVASKIERVVSKNIFTNVYGLCRTILAISTLLTLTFNSGDILFHPVAGVDRVPSCSSISQYSIFCVFPEEYRYFSRAISILILFIVASGWRPRITGILHWWVSFSLISSASLIDGGDHVTSVITLLLIPATLADDRTWHWEKRNTPLRDRWEPLKRLIALSSFIVIRIQISVIYFHSAVGKMGVEEWANGTALYYWFFHPTYGAADWMRTPVEMLLGNDIIVTVMTWSVILFEILLSVSLVAPRRYKSIMLPTSITFHCLIALIHGLPTFSLTMIGALIIYLRPFESDFKIRSLNVYKYPRAFLHQVL